MVASGESESRSFLAREEGASEGSSVSVSEPLAETSSSQDSATGADFGLLAGFWGDFAESLSWERVVATSANAVRLELRKGGLWVEYRLRRVLRETCWRGCVRT